MDERMRDIITGLVSYLILFVIYYLNGFELAMIAAAAIVITQLNKQ